MLDSISGQEKFIGKYKILSTLGKGGMGVVYKGFDPYIERTVAIKTISIDFGAEHGDVDKWRKRFLREAKLAGNLSHPNIVTVFEVGEYSDGFYIAMEYIEGHSLRDLIMSPDYIPVEQLWSLMEQVFAGFSFAHKQGVIHCDIKPENIMIAGSGKVIIVDFGIARPAASTLTVANQSVFIGTPSYVAPERLKGVEPDVRSDIFSLGATVYEVLAKRKAFHGENISCIITQILQEDPPRPSSIRPDLPEGIDAILAKALAKEPEERYQDYKEFYDDLVACWSLHLRVGQDSAQGKIRASSRDKKGMTGETGLGDERTVSGLATRPVFGPHIRTGGTHLDGFHAERPPVDHGRATGSFFRRRVTWALIGLVAIFFTGFFAAHLGKLWKNTRSQSGEVSPVEQTEKQPTDSKITSIQAGSDKLEEPSPVARKQERIDEYRAQAMAYLAEEKHRDAISAFEKILELDPGNEEAKKNIELAKKEVTKRVAVEESYRKGIESMDKGNYVEAVSSFAKVLELDPENKAARENIKLASKELSRRTVEENYYAGMDRMVKEDYSGAITFFEKVLEVDPENQDAKQKIELAKKKLISRTIDKKDRKRIEPIPEQDRAAATTSRGVDQTPPESNVLRLIYNQNCIGKTGPAELFIDERSYGVMTPGSEIAVGLSVGNHKVSLVDEEGNQWGPYTQTVQYGGGTRTFSCKFD